MSPAEQRQIADACAAVIAAAIEEVVAEHPDASPAAQARRVVRQLRSEGWHITAAPCARLSADHAPAPATPPINTSAPVTDPAAPLTKGKIA